MEYSNFFVPQRFFSFRRNMEYSEYFRLQRFFRTFGIWNIQNKNCNNKIIKNIGIWNIPGIFPKKWYTTKICKILEYRIFHGIFLEYSKNCKTSHGGVKFNQGQNYIKLWIKKVNRMPLFPIITKK